MVSRATGMVCGAKENPPTANRGGLEAGRNPVPGEESWIASYLTVTVTQPDNVPPGILGDLFRVQKVSFPLKPLAGV